MVLDVCKQMLCWELALMILWQHKGLCWSWKNVEFCRPVVSVSDVFVNVFVV